MSAYFEGKKNNKQKRNLKHFNELLLNKQRFSTWTANTRFVVEALRLMTEWYLSSCYFFPNYNLIIFFFQI